MIDLHTHILCGVDDGAKNVEESLQLLRMEQEQGVGTVVLTPHFYRTRQEPEQFLAVRDAAMDTLLSAVEGQELPRLVLGAEVAWWPNMAHWDGLERLCIAGTRTMLLELPFSRWSSDLCHQLYDLVNRTGITPVLAHLERYLSCQDRGLVREILSLGMPVQITARELLHLTTRGSALKALRSWGHVLATDCHDCRVRKPDLGDAMAMVEKKLGRDAAASLQKTAQSLLK